MALWGGRFAETADDLVARLSQSISFDQRLYRQDIQGSIAHVRMLAACGIVPTADAEAIAAELTSIQDEIEAGSFPFDETLEDIHMNIESRLIERLGDVGGRLHAARSRNDQIATDLRLYLREVVDRLGELLTAVQRALVDLGSEHVEVIMPGFTHLQHAQPVLFAHHLLAYVEMFARDAGRLTDCRKRLNELPLGAGALAGSTLPIDRQQVADTLGFDRLARNSMDAVSDRDFAVELLGALSLIMMHLSRLAEDVIFWKSQECAFIDIGDAFCTGSSLMPQKKNPDVAELTRGKCARVYGDLQTVLTVLKGLPLCYNRDLQEDKEPVFDAVDTVELLLQTWAAMLPTVTVNAGRMRAAAADPALMATDLAEWLVRVGVPFRQAHEKVGRLVAWCNGRGRALDELSLAEMRETIPEAEPACLELFDPARSVAARDLVGGTAPARVRGELAAWRERLAQ